MIGTNVEKLLLVSKIIINFTQIFKLITMKRILGLDLGTTSIGFAYVVEGETPEKSLIKEIGVRVNPLTTDELSNFEKGKSISVNADRTSKRSARRNLQRFKLRREVLIKILKENKIITENTVLAEEGKGTTFQTLKLRAQAAKQKVSLSELARLFLIINKKRGYKSSRKAKNEEGQLIDGMSIARKLYEQNLTPGQFVYELINKGNKSIPDFYRSDLQNEFDRVWDFQKQFYADIFINDKK